MADWIRFLRERWQYFDAVLALALIVGALVYIYDLLVGSRGLDVAYITRNYTLYLHAVLTNVYATTIAFLAGMAIGFSVGWLRTARTVSLAKFAGSMRVEKRERQEDASGSESARRLMVVLSLLWFGTKYVIRRIGDGFVEIIRGTPLYVQILFASSYFIIFLPQYASEGILIGIIALAINTGGYQAEIFRAGRCGRGCRGGRRRGRAQAGNGYHAQQADCPRSHTKIHEDGFHAS